MKPFAFNREKLKKTLNPRVVQAYKDRVLSTQDIFKNTLDPFSAVLDAKLLNKSISSWISEVEVPRKTQKTIQNVIGIIHQEILSTVEGWEDLGTGQVLDLKNDKEKIIAEIKNKHNTTKGNHKKEIYNDINSLLNTTYKGYTGYYVEILPKNGKIYNKAFTPSDNVLKNQRPANNNIRIIGWIYHIRRWSRGLL